MLVLNVGGFMKRDLYIDCDGVIYNTIDYAFQNMKTLGIDVTNQDAITNYFKNCNWVQLIRNGGQINNSCQKIVNLKRSNLFRNVAVATHHCSFIESQIKNTEFEKELENIQIFNIPKKIPKHFALNARGHILVDDALEKIIGWINDGGYGVLFNQSAEGLSFPSYHQPYFITNDLSDLIVINNFINYNLEEEKKLNNSKRINLIRR